MRRASFACWATCVSSLALAAFGCSTQGDTGGAVSSGPTGRPDDSVGGAPVSAAPTGQRWEGIEIEDACGRKQLQYVLVDETCGSIDSPDYARAFQAPMFRDGALVGDHLFAIDATHLWSLEVATSGDPVRRNLLSGIGLPLAIEAYGSSLAIASGNAGLVLVDATNPAAPARSGNITLPGFATDVTIDGTRAYVAIGKKGIAVVDLATTPPVLLETIDVPNAFAAGVKVKGSHAYVAACSTFAVIDLTMKSVVGRTWRPDAVDARNVLVAPAKDVELVGDVAYVAAGRFGAVAIDVSQPASPQILGNCTNRSDPAFYASGVRADGSSLYVAAGEFGVYPVDVTTPASACATDNPPSAAAPAKTDCSADAPWEIVPWQELWAPPPPKKDPIQTRPAGTKLYAFGDARRIGTRAVDVRDTTQASLPVVHRYDEPRAVLSIAASATRVIAAGPRGGVFDVNAAGLTRTVTPNDATIQGASAVAFVADGSWAALVGQDVLREDGSSISVGEVNGEVLVADGADLYVASESVVYTITGSIVRPYSLATVQTAKLPPSLAVAGSIAYFAAPESQLVYEIGVQATRPLQEHGLYPDEALTDVALWQQRLPRHLLAITPSGVVDVAGIGPYSGVALRGNTGLRTAALPALTYGAIASSGDRVFVAGIDRGLYRSTVVTISTKTGSPIVVGTEVFTGVVSSIAALGSKVYVADADGRIRIYDASDTGLTHVADVSLESP